MLHAAIRRNGVPPFWIQHHNQCLCAHQSKNDVGTYHQGRAGLIKSDLLLKDTDTKDLLWRHLGAEAVMFPTTGAHSNSQTPSFQTKKSHQWMDDGHFGRYTSHFDAFGAVFATLDATIFRIPFCRPVNEVGLWFPFKNSLLHGWKWPPFKGAKNLEKSR